MTHKKWIFKTALKKQDSLTSASATGENVYLLDFISTFVFFKVYVEYFFDVARN